MGFPVMEKKARKSFSVEHLSGGLNLRDSLHSVDDTQLTDAVNVWFHDGLLKNRPGMSCFVAELDREISRTLKTRLHKAFLGDAQLCSVDAEVITPTETERRIYFFWCGAEHTRKLPFIKVDNQGVGSEIHYFAFQHSDILYCFVDRKVYRLKNGDTAWCVVKGEEMYEPLVATDCKAQFGVCIKKNLALATGERKEDFDILSGRYRMIYSTVNPEIITDGGTLAMHYWLPFACQDFKNGEKIIVKYTNQYGTEYIHTLVCNGSIIIEESEPPGDGMYLRMSNMNLSFRDVETQSSVQWWAAQYIKNNLEISAPCLVEEEYIKRLFDMSEPEWFGGASAGLNGGTRMFLCGNTNPEYGGMMMWSELNDPLCFPQNCYMVVGDPSQPITTFAKQSDMLVIFKENETYYTRHTQSTSKYAAELRRLDETQPVDAKVYFPLTLIHSRIGCDCPKTVQLCRNRLVWANSGGQVYSLIIDDEFSERSIYEIGEMISKRLCGESNIKNAVSCDWEGHYLLLCDNRAYLMDYNSHGFQYAYSYRKNEDANARIPWYFWELHQSINDCDNNIVLAVPKETLCLFGCCSKEKDGSFLNTFNLLHENNDDGGLPIHSKFRTKLFDFSEFAKKNVERVSLMLGNNSGAEIGIGFVTDCVTEFSQISLNGEQCSPYSPEYISTVTLTPCVRAVSRFGISLECEGVVALDSILFDYRLL